MIDYLLGYFKEEENIKQIKDEKELLKILNKYRLLSAIKISIDINKKYKFKYYYSKTRNIDRVTNFFNYVEKIILDIKPVLNKPKYILMTHWNAIKYNDCEYPIISSSRECSNKKIILWSQYFKLSINTELNKYLDIKNKDKEWNKKKNIFFF